MAFTQKDGQGALFRNERKTKDSGPDYRGDITVNGVSYWLAAWLKDGKKGEYMSLAITAKDGTVVAKKQDEDSSIPF